jgi:hypothetical protein
MSNIPASPTQKALMSTATTEMSFPAATDAGMFALWHPAWFATIIDYPTWEASLHEDRDIAAHIDAGHLVPVNIGGDGAFQFLVRANASHAPTLTERERRYHVVASQPYRFQSPGAAYLTGIEHIGAEPWPGTTAIALPEGQYAVTVNVIDWEAEPGAQDPQGRPTPQALPDFVVLIGPPRGDDIAFRTKIQTFDLP